MRREKINTFQVKKVNKLILEDEKNSYLKIWEMGKVSPDIFREEELSETIRCFTVLYDKFRKGLKEKDAVKNAWHGVVKVLDFI